MDATPPDITGLSGLAAAWSDQPGIIPPGWVPCASVAEPFVEATRFAASPDSDGRVLMNDGIAQQHTLVLHNTADGNAEALFFFADRKALLAWEESSDLPDDCNESHSDIYQSRTWPNVATPRGAIQLATHEFDSTGEGPDGVAWVMIQCTLVNRLLES